MNNVASFLASLPMRPLADQQELRKGFESSGALSTEGGSDFNTLLSGLAQSVSADNAPLPTRQTASRPTGESRANTRTDATANAASTGSTGSAAARASLLWQGTSFAAQVASGAGAASSTQLESTATSAAALAEQRQPNTVVTGGKTASAASTDSAGTDIGAATPLSTTAVAEPSAETIRSIETVVAPQSQTAVRDLSLNFAFGTPLIAGSGASLETAIVQAAGVGVATSSRADATPAVRTNGVARLGADQADSQVKTESASPATTTANPVALALAAMSTGLLAAAPVSGNGGAKGSSGTTAGRANVPTTEQGSPQLPLQAKALPQILAQSGPSAVASEDAAPSLQMFTPTDAASGSNSIFKASMVAAGLADQSAAAMATMPTAATTTDSTSSIKLTVISTATHFAPTARLSPVQQIANAVMTAFPALAPSLAPVVASAAEADIAVSVAPTVALAQPSAPAVRTLNLSLEPASLGTVTITLSLSANGLDIQMAASQPSTTSLIESEKQTLSDQLRQSGYSVTSLMVTQGATQDGSGIANNGSAGQGANGQPQTGLGMAAGGQSMSQGGASHGNNSPQNQSPTALGGSGARQDAGGSTTDRVVPGFARGAFSGELYI